MTTYLDNSGPSAMAARANVNCKIVAGMLAREMLESDDPVKTLERGCDEIACTVGGWMAYHDEAMKIYRERMLTINADSA